MNKRKYSKSRKNPLVRFIRWVYKTFNTLFKPKKRAFRSTALSQISSSEYITEHIDIGTTPIAESDNYVDNRLLTVAELFEQVNWQFSVAEIQQTVLEGKLQKDVVKSADRQQGTSNKLNGLTALTGIVGLEGYAKDRLITVSDLFEHVKWQVPQTSIQKQVLELSGIPRPLDVSRN